jgi:hypothetical protein
LPEKATLLLLVGGWGKTSLDRAMREAHQAAALDLLDTLWATEMIDKAVVATDDPAWRDALNEIPVVVDMDPTGTPFHFGRRLAGLIAKHRPRRVLYSGGASAPLLSRGRWIEILTGIGASEQIAVTNNLHSCDWVGFAPTDEALSLIAGQENDNSIAWILANEAATSVQSLPPSAATRFDLDTPVDLLIARRHPGIGPHLRRFLSELDWQYPQLDGVLAEMTREGGSLIIAGRVSEAAWRLLRQTTRCWVRVFAEERGMRASGRQERGEVRSLLADYLELVGPDGFFDEMAQLASGVLLDSRMVFSARGLNPSRTDRFNSDLYRWKDIKDPFVRDLTRAAAEAQVPVVLGGHSVVAGGLMALIESMQTSREETLCRES